MTVKYSFVMSDKDISDATVSLSKTVSSTRVKVHQIAVSILHNWAEHGAANVACNRAAELLKAMDPSHAQKAVNWFAKYGGLKLEGKKDEKKFIYTESKITSNVYQDARKQSMFDLSKDTDPKPFNDIEKLDHLIRAVSSRVTSKGASEDDVIHFEMWREIRAVAAKYREAAA
jgi:hypothetical protein